MANTHRKVTKPLLILLVAEFALAWALGLYGEIYRSETARAFAVWRENPTRENRLAFHREKRITEIQQWSVSGVFFVAMVIPTILIYRRIRKGNCGP